MTPNPEELSREGLIAAALPSLGSEERRIVVALSNELVHLLSDQLYQSPLKAIEELVVNSYDAGATECRLYVPESISSLSGSRIMVFDNGAGMDLAGLMDLWQIGRSNKRSAEIERRSSRKQIGKFGIGKLATYTIAHRLTYLTRQDGGILVVSIDFRNFTTGPTGAGEPIELSVHNLSNWRTLEGIGSLKEDCTAAGIDLERLNLPASPSWTLAVLEELKPKAEKIRTGRLRWVLQTAMPLKSDFHLFLNSAEIFSSKQSLTPLVSFAVVDLPGARLKSLREKTSEDWKSSGDHLVSSSFPSGISGDVIVTRQSLHTGKSEDIGRSHGFFIRVRGRLINEEDPLFGLNPLSYQTFNRFRADLDVDDLDVLVTAPREGVEEAPLKTRLESLLAELFYEARDRYEQILKEEDEAAGRKRESERSFIAPRLVEHPVADVLADPAGGGLGAEPDSSWFYLEIEPVDDISGLIRDLYNERRRRYKYEYSQHGPSGRIVRFNPAASIFSLNADHPFVMAHADNPRAQVLLEDFVTAEALLEVYLREAGIQASKVGEILERRDALLRGLAEDHPFSFEGIASSLRDARSDKYNLEVALVTAVRAIGFVAKHVGGGDEPDGIARLTDYPEGERVITLEAKSSEKKPSLGSIDVAGLADHVRKHRADGCLLVAPAYPGEARGELSAISKRARADKISCWTIDQLASFVQVAESRHLTARHLLDIVLTDFAPEDVMKAVGELLEKPRWEVRGLYTAILSALKDLDGRLVDSPRTIDLVAAEVSRDREFREVSREVIDEAVRNLASASQGAMTVRENRIVLHVSYDEVARRLSGITGAAGTARREGDFRGNFDSTPLGGRKDKKD